MFITTQQSLSRTLPKEERGEEVWSDISKKKKGNYKEFVMFILMTGNSDLCLGPCMYGDVGGF